MLVRETALLSHTHRLESSSFEVDVETLESVVMGHSLNRQESIVTDELSVTERIEPMEECEGMK